MKQISLLVFTLLLLCLGACGDDDDFNAFGGCVDTEYPAPEWYDADEGEVVYIETTNTPQVQINRFVASNNLDTVQTSSGLVYSIIEPGGVDRPGSASVVEIWVKGYLMDGSIFEESDVCRSGPLTINISNLIPALREGLLEIGKGGKMTLLARPSIAYGGSTPSNGNFVLVFELELLDFNEL